MGMGFYLDMDVTGGNGERPKRMKEAKTPVKNCANWAMGSGLGREAGEKEKEPKTLMMMGNYRNMCSKEHESPSSRSQSSTGLWKKTVWNFTSDKAFRGVNDYLQHSHVLALLRARPGGY